MRGNPPQNKYEEAKNRIKSGEISSLYTNYYPIRSPCNFQAELASIKTLGVVLPKPNITFMALSTLFVLCILKLIFFLFSRRVFLKRF